VLTIQHCAALTAYNIPSSVLFSLTKRVVNSSETTESRALYIGNTKKAASQLEYLFYQHGAPTVPDQFWAQALGMLSFALGLFCFFQKNDARLKYVMLAVTFNNALHFALLGATTSVIAALFSAIRTAASLYSSSARIAYAFIIVGLGIGFYASSRWLDMLPVLGACIGTYALFCLSGIPMRIALLGGTLCWLINNIIVGSIGGTLLELSLLLMNIKTIRSLRLAPLNAQP